MPLVPISTGDFAAIFSGVVDVRLIDLCVLFSVVEEEEKVEGEGWG